MRDHCGGVNKNVVRAEGGEVEKLARKLTVAAATVEGSLNIGIVELVKRT